jgi:hypothetical protein
MEEQREVTAVTGTHPEPVPVPNSPGDTSSEAPSVAGVVNVHEPVHVVEHPVVVEQPQEEHVEHHEG